MEKRLVGRLTSEAQDKSLSDCILQHLRLLLNSRHGDSPATPDYGLPDLNDVHREQGPFDHEFSRAVKECIEQYEPRLERVRVTSRNPHPGSVERDFAITATIKSSREPVRIDGLIGSSGRVLLR